MQQDQVRSTWVLLGTTVYGTVDGYFTRKVVHITYPYYVDGDEPGSITRLAIDNDERLNVGTSHTTGGDGPIDVARCDDRQAVVVANYRSNSIGLLNATDPDLGVLDVVYTCEGPRSIAVVRTTAFVACTLDDEIYQYWIDANNQLRALGTVAAGRRPLSVVSNRAGTHLYVLNQASRDVSVYRVSTSDPAVLEDLVDTVHHVVPLGLHFAAPSSLAWNDVSQALAVTLQLTSDYHISNAGYMAIIRWQSDDHHSVEYVRTCEDPVLVTVDDEGRFLVACGESGRLEIHTDHDPVQIQLWPGLATVSTA